MKPETLEKIDWLKQNPTDSIRIDGRDFREMLIDNHSVIVGGNVRYIQGIPIGEGVYRIKLLPKEWDREFGTIKLDPGTDWITKGTGLALKNNKVCCKGDKQ
jgi:hypothetical protein